MIKKIVKRGGEMQDFQPSKVNGWGEWASETLGNLVDWSSVVLHTVSVCPEVCTSKMLQESLIKTCLDNDTWSYNRMAGRLYAALLNKQVHGGKTPTVLALHRRLECLGLMVRLDYSDKEYAEVEKMINHKRDFKAAHFELEQARSKYAIRNRVTGEEFETQQFIYMRMAMALSETQPLGRRMGDVLAFYNHFSQKRLNAPTPNYVNLGTPMNGLASCAIYKAGDSAKSLAIGDHIAYTLTYMSAGIGSYLETRSINDEVRGGAIRHQGKLPYYRSLDGAVHANLQAGRGGACTTYFSAFDPEAEVITRLKNPMSTKDKQIRGIDYAMIQNKFLAKKAAKGEDVFFFNVHTAPKLTRLLFSGDAEAFEREYYRFEEESTKELKYASAREILLGQINEGYETGKAYLMWADEMNRHTPHKDAIHSSNLCFTGETLVAVADGSNAETIQSLAQKSGGKLKFPVYSARPSRGGKKGWVTEIKQAVAFRSGYKQTVEVLLSDGSYFRCTEDHKLALASGGYVEARKSSGKELKSFFTTLGGTRKYRHINSCTNGHSKQHLMIWKSNYGLPPENHHVDHIENIANDHISNLQVMPREDHFKKTGLEFCGENNAVHKMHDPEHWKNECCKSSTLEGNGRYLGLTNEDIYNLAYKVHSLGESITFRSLKGLDSRMPTSFSKNRFGGKISNLAKMVKSESGFKDKEIKFPDMEKKTKDIYKGEGITKVISVVDTGDTEEVYDLTVEDNHNFYIITKTQDSEYLECSGVLVHNCLETALPTESYNSMLDLYSEDITERRGEVASCSLAAITVSNIKSDKEYEDVAYYALLMIDKCIHKSDYPLPNVGATTKARMNAGVGVVGLAHYMAKNKFLYTSDEGKQEINKVFEKHSYHVIKASLKLGKELGNAAWIGRTKWPEGWLPIDTYNRNVDGLVGTDLEYNWEELRSEIIANGGIRNSSLVNHMPTESSSKISGTTNSVYPIRELTLMKTDSSNVVYWAAPEGDKLGKWYESAWDIPTKDLIDVYSIIQKWADQSISADFYRKIIGSDTVTTKEMLTNHFYMTKMGMKTRYYINSYTSSTGKINTGDEESCESCSL